MQRSFKRDQNIGRSSTKKYVEQSGHDNFLVKKIQDCKAKIKNGGPLI